MFPKSLAFSLMFIAFSTCAANAENWPHWRGANYDGVATGNGYPVEWGEQKNILWKVEVPGWGTSSPAVWEEQIFATGTLEEKNALFCFDQQGKQQWQVTFGPTANNKNRKASAANPSPITDGTHVYAYYKSGDLACVDLAGKIVWQTNLQKEYGPDRLGWDLGTSPVLAGGAVVVAVMHAGPSYVVALDKKTGKELWQQSRNLGAPAEARDSYTTPLVVDQQDRQLVVVLGADHVTAHVAETGEEVWRVGNLNPRQARNYRSIASPALAGDMIVAPYSRGNSLTGIRRGGSGDVTDTHVAWTIDVAADVPSPVIHEGHIYICSDRGAVSCIELASGKEQWNLPLPRNRYPFSASPILAEGRLYATREDGTTFVIKLGDQPELLATNSLYENTYATPAFADGKIYLRTSDYLFCIGEN